MLDHDGSRSIRVFAYLNLISSILSVLPAGHQQSTKYSFSYQNEHTWTLLYFPYSMRSASACTRNFTRPSHPHRVHHTRTRTHPHRFKLRYRVEDSDSPPRVTRTGYSVRARDCQACVTPPPCFHTLVLGQIPALLFPLARHNFPLLTFACLPPSTKYSYIRGSRHECEHSCR